MAQMKIDLSLSAQGYVKGLNDANKETKVFTNQITNLTKDLPNLKKEFRDASKMVTNMTLALSRMTREQKNSAEGQALQRALDETKQKAAELKDMLSDTQEEIKNMASDTRNIEALSQGFTVAGNAASGFVGILGMVTGKQEDFNKAIAMFTTVQSVANTVEGIANAFEKQSHLLIGITTLQQKAKNAAIKLGTIAQNANTGSTIAATAAQKAFNAVANANPYVLLATAIAAVSLAFIGLASSTSDAEKAEKEQQEQLDRNKEVAESYAQKVGENLGKTTVAYKTLSKEYSSLKTEMEKTKFIKDHANEINELELGIWNVATADKYLKDDTKDVVKAFELRAKAAAAAAMAVQMYTEAAKESVLKTDKSSYEGANISIADYNRLPEEIKKKATAKTTPTRYTSNGPGQPGTYSGGETVGYVLKNITDEDAAKLAALGLVSTKHSKLQQEFEKKARAFFAQVDKFQDKANALIAPSDKKIETVKPTKGSTADKIKTQIDALEAEKKKLEEAKNALVKEVGGEMVISDQAKFDELKKSIDEVEKKIKQGKALLEDKSPLEKLKDELKDLEELRPFAETDEELKKINEDIKNLKAQIEAEEIRLGIKTDPKEEALKKIKDQIKAVNAELSNSEEDKIQANFTGLDKKAKADADNIYAEYIKVYKALQSLEKLKIDIDPNTEGFKLLEDEIDKLNEKLKGLTDQVKEFNNTSSEREDKTEKIEKQAEAWGYYSNMLSSVSDATDMLGDSQEAQWAKWTLQTAATIAQLISQIAALQASAMAKATDAGAGLPFPANLGAIAAGVAAVISVFKSLPKHANGGIVEGSTTIGDSVLSRLNAGEMVLNKRQQSFLFNAIDHNRLGGSFNNELYGVVTVKGSDLKIAMSNNDKINKRAH